MELQAVVAVLLALGGSIALGSGTQRRPQNKIPLRDHPIATGAAPLYLDSCDSTPWSAHSTDPGRPALRIDAAVPGDIISDLHAAGVIPHPYFETAWKNSTAWAGGHWAYSTSFLAPALPANRSAVLVFDGIKMGATIALNGVALGVASDQFVRYRFDVTRLLRPSPRRNTLQLAFDNSIGTAGRFMTCSGQADWAPYSNTQQASMPTFSFGIWKSVSLNTVSSVAIVELVPHVFYRGAYPASILNESSKADFEVRVRLHLWAPSAGEAQLVVSGEWGAEKQRTVRFPAGDSNVSLSLRAPAAAVRLWWPAGVGGQPLYRVNATLLHPAHGAAVTAVTASRSIGFRHVALVTGNDTAPSYVRQAAGAEGSERHGM